MYVSRVIVFIKYHNLILINFVKYIGKPNMCEANQNSFPTIIMTRWVQVPYFRSTDFNSRDSIVIVVQSTCVKIKLNYYTQ